MKIRWVVPRGWTDMTKLFAAFRNLVKAPTNVILNTNNATPVNNSQQKEAHHQYINII